MSEAATEPLGSSTPRRRAARPRMAWPGLLGGLIVAFWLAMAILGPAIAPHEVGQIVDQDVFSPVSREFPLGTDYLGRDMLSRILYGARFTVGVALLATCLASGCGLVLGMCAAAWGSTVDAVLSRALDTVVSIPSKMLALVVVAALGSSLPVLVLVSAVIYTPGAYRIARSLAVDVNAQDFVTVARARGEGTWFVVRQEILPNIVGPMLADFGLRFVYVVLLLSGLSFLGLGIQPPNADWGALVRENMSGLAEGAAAVLTPALAIATLTIGVNLVVDNLQRRRRGA